MSLNLDTPAGLKILGTDYPGIEKILTILFLLFFL